MRCFYDLLAFLHDVQRGASSNMMTAENLAICFAPNVLLIDADSPSAMRDLQPAIAITERLILAAPLLLGDAQDTGAAASRPPPPPAPPLAARPPPPMPPLSSPPRPPPPIRPTPPTPPPRPY